MLSGISRPEDLASLPCRTRLFLDPASCHSLVFVAKRWRLCSSVALMMVGPMRRLLPAAYRSRVDEVEETVADGVSRGEGGCGECDEHSPRGQRASCSQSRSFAHPLRRRLPWLWMAPRCSQHFLDCRGDAPYACTHRRMRLPRQVSGCFCK